MQRNGWKIILPALAIATLTWLPSASAADEPELIAQIERPKIYEGESVLYRLTLNNVEHPREPDLKALAVDFQVVPAGQQSLDSHMITIINGDRSETVHWGRQYNYRLTPKRTGTLTIPAPTVEIGGRQLRGQEITLVVRSPEEQDVVRMEIRADRDSVYPTQPFTVTLLVSVKSLPKPYDDRNPVSVAPPALDIPWAVDDHVPSGVRPSIDWRRWLGPMQSEDGAGFNVNDLGGVVMTFSGLRRSAFMPHYEKVRLPDRSGKETEYWRFEFRRAFVPKAIGTYTFGPVSLKGKFATEVNEAGRATLENVYAVAKPLTVEVRDVPPEGRPDCYIGAVGVFHLAADLEPKKAKTGDPMTLTLTLDGEGTLDNATAPNLGAIPAIAEHFKVYAPTEQAKKDQRQFTYSLRPLDTDVREFPAVPAAYFDVDARRYVTLRSQPIPIEVTKSMRLASRDIIAAGGGLAGSSKEIEARQGGIFANITDPGQLSDDSIRPERWLAGLGGLAAGYVALAFAVGRWRRLSGDTAMLRRARPSASPGESSTRRRLTSPLGERAKGPTTPCPPHSDWWPTCSIYPPPA